MTLRGQPEPGTLVAHYELQEVLGEGGMGVVWRGVDRRLQRSVALKLLRPAALHDQERLRLMQQEARAVAALNHPNIVTLYGIEETHYGPCLVMEMVEGPTLEELLSHVGLPLSEFLGVALPLTRAIAAAHEAGVVHHDLKPANVLCPKSGSIKVLDFGLARCRRAGPITDDVSLSATTLWRPGRGGGTLPYMAPEQVRGDPTDARTDVYSLGVLFFELLAGRRPFAADSTAELVSSILRDPPPSLSQLRSLPAELLELIEACLAKDPAERPDSAGVLEARLATLRSVDGASDAGPVVAAPSPPPAQGGRIAVLPFRDLSPDGDQEYFCDGVAEEIRNALQKAQGLRVASWRSAQRLHRESASAAEIGRELDVETLLEGSVRKAGDRFRVVVQQVSASTGDQLWSERYDGESQDVFAIQDEIAQNVREALGARLTSSAARRSTPSPDFLAYDHYLRGKRLLHRFRHADQEQARSMFERAVEIDPTYALAHAGIGLASAEIFYWFDRSEDNCLRAVAASERALELRPRLAEAHLARAMTWAIQGEKENAYREFETAGELDPTSYEIFYFWGRSAFNFNDMELSAQKLEKAIEVGPDEYQAYCIISVPYEALGRTEDQQAAHQGAVRAARRHLQLFPDDGRALSMSSISLVETGAVEEGRRNLERALELDPEDPMNLYTCACTYCRMGELDLALACLAKAIRAGGLSRRALEHDLDLAPLHDDPRFLELLDQMR